MNFRATLALVVLLSAVVPAIGITTAETITTIDDDHGLTDEQSIEQYQRTGYASASITAPEITISVAKDKESVGVSGITPSDLRTDYIRIQYQEEIERTIRVYIPSEYYSPYTRNDVEAVNEEGDGITADYKPVLDGKYLAVTIHVTGPTDVVLPVKAEATAFSEMWKSNEKRVEKGTGTDIRGDTPWNYVPQSSLSENATYTVPLNSTDQNYVVQYNDSGEWINAPSDPDAPTSIYVEQRDVDNGSQVLIVSQTDNPPEVRYKTNQTQVDAVTGAFREIAQIPSRVSNLLGGLGDLFGFGGTSGQDNTNKHATETPS